MSHGIRVEDIAWQAFQAGARGRRVLFDEVKDGFVEWWAARREQGCALPGCEKCGYDPTATVTASWSFHVGRPVRSGNEHVSNVGGSRWTYKAERLGWERDMRTLRLVHRIPVATTKRRITLTRCYGKGKRAFDRDNLATGLKPAVDAMVKAGLLIGDRPDQAEIHYDQRKGDEGLDVLIEEVAS